MKSISNKRVKSIALITVIVYLVVLSLLITPLVSIISQVVGANFKMMQMPAKLEFKSSLAELVKYNINKYTGDCSVNITPDTASYALAQGTINITNLSCIKEFTSLDQPYLRYWTFIGEANLSYATLTTTIQITGTAVQILEPYSNDTITYILDIR